MKFYKNLYVGDTIKKPDKVIKKLKKYAKLPNIHVIAYAQEHNRLEIYHSLMLQQWYYKEHSPYIIGIAGSQEEAVGLIAQMTEDAVSQTGQADLISYLFQKGLQEELMEEHQKQ
ncbi:MAG: hypothetical protein LUI12_10260 [Clostridiales bacterium]|nr:hypothetical protein [Clostridiales bacterium]